MEQDNGIVRTQLFHYQKVSIINSLHKISTLKYHDKFKREQVENDELPMGNLRDAFFRDNYQLSGSTSAFTHVGRVYQTRIPLG